MARHAILDRGVAWMLAQMFKMMRNSFWCPIVIMRCQWSETQEDRIIPTSSVLKKKHSTILIFKKS